MTLAIAATGVSSAPRVLVVDDDEEMRRLLHDLFASLGIASAEAADGAEAIAMLDRAAWSAVILDLGLPRVDGFGVLAHVARRDQELLERIIVISGFRSFHDRAREYGAVRFISKPLHMATLLGYLDDFGVLGQASEGSDR